MLREANILFRCWWMIWHHSSTYPSKSGSSILSLVFLILDSSRCQPTVIFDAKFYIGPQNHMNISFNICFVSLFLASTTIGEDGRFGGYSSLGHLFSTPGRWSSSLSCVASHCKGCVAPWLWRPSWNSWDSVEWPGGPGGPWIPFLYSHERSGACLLHLVGSSLELFQQGFHGWRCQVGFHQAWLGVFKKLKPQAHHSYCLPKIGLKIVQNSSQNS